MTGVAQAKTYRIDSAGYVESPRNFKKTVGKLLPDAVELALVDSTNWWLLVDPVSKYRLLYVGTPETFLKWKKPLQIVD